MKHEDIEDLYELSPTQQGMLFHSLYDTSAGLYIEQTILKIEGDFNVAAFRKAWRQVIEFHPELRTSYSWEGTQKPLQIVNRNVSPVWDEYDWSNCLPNKQQWQLEELVRSDRHRGFDFSQAPLMRFILIYLGSGSYMFIWSFHHILIDGWSVPLLFNKLISCYEANCRLQEPHLERSRPYSDYIAWLQSLVLDEAEKYWKNELSGFSSPTPLMGYTPRKDSPTVKLGYAQARARLSRSITDSIKALARRYQLTLNTVVQGAWSLLLSRYSGNDDVLFGITVSGRPPELRGVESMIGLFLNTIPLRVQINNKEKFINWLQQLQNKQVEQRDYEYCPLVSIRSWSGIKGGEPFFHSLLVFENYPANVALEKQENRLQARLKISKVATVERINYPITLVAAPGQELSLMINHDQAAFDKETISRMIRHLERVLEGVAANPDRPVGEIEILSEEETGQILREWNRTEAEYPRERGVHKLIERQVEKVPEAIAIECGEGHVSCGEMNRRANRLAHYLMELGAGPEVRVGVCLGRGVEMVVSLLAILKAGGAYVPLDGEYPKQRLGYMLEDAGVAVLVSESGRIESLPENIPTLVRVDLDREAIASRREDNPESGVGGENPAYVIYTSGSTGTPKGVMITHRGLVNYLTWCSKNYEISRWRGAPVHSSLGFDLTVTSLFGPLIEGKMVDLLDEQRGVEGLIEKLREERGYSLVKLTPSHLEYIGERMGREGVVEAEVVVIGGEALKWESVKKWRGVWRGRRIINEYGPTETVVGSVVYEIGEENAAEGGAPIGKPIANTKIYILDGEGRPAPIGVSGELHIAGDGLARGYVNRAELTAERFIPNPHGAERGERMYRTGDVARYLPDGNIEYLGRADHQVKIRGHRIELGEVEAALASHRSVKQAVVVARGEGPAEKRLVGYVVREEGSEAGVGELRGHLRERLPEYMIPAAFVFLEEIPLTVNKKIDRLALPAPLFPTVEEQTTFVEPRDSTELQLTRIWENILHTQPIGVKDNFFDVGGNSVLAISIISSIKRIFGQTLRLSDLFEYPTVEHLASIVRRQKSSRNESPLVSMQPLGAKPPIFCVHPAGGNILCYADLARCLSPDQPLWGLEAKGLYGEAKPYTRIEEIAKYYIKAIRKVQKKGPYLLAGWSMGGTVAFEMAQQLYSGGHKVALLAILDTNAVVSDYEREQVEKDDAHILVEWLGDSLNIPTDEFTSLHPDARMTYILEKAKEQDKLPSDIEPMEIQAMFQVFKTNSRAMNVYVPRTYADRITLFKAGLKSHRDATLGWGKLAHGGVDIREVPGSHRTLLSKKHVGVLAEQLKASIKAVEY